MLAQSTEANDIKTLREVSEWLRYVDNPVNFLTEFPHYLEQSAAMVLGKEPMPGKALRNNSASLAIAESWLHLSENDKLCAMKIFTIAVMMGGNKLPGTPASGTEKLFDDVLESFRAWYESRPRTN